MPIGSDDTSETLAPKLAAVGAELMLETLRGIESGQVKPSPQDHALATLAPILKKEDGRMDFSRTAIDLFNRMRGFKPWPGAFTTFRGKNMQVHRAQAMNPAGKLSPGMLAMEGPRLIAGCGQSTALDLLEIQLDGKRRMTAQEFINGYQPKPGDLLGE
jgi:methionyl-tRNA formyltransferase